MNGPLNIAANSGIDGLEITQSGSGEALSITGGNALFGDNDKAIFGIGNDLQIYHDGSHSYIKDAGTGQLRLLAGTNVQIWNADATNLAANFNGDTQTSLYYAGSSKLSTTASGIDVTGTIVGDGLTVDTSSTGGFKVEDRGVEGAGVKVTAYQGTTNANVRQLDIDAYQVNVSTGAVTGTTVTDRLLIADNGDISFYEDTGTTPKFVWDASAESLTLSGTGGLTVDGDAYISDTLPRLILNETDATDLNTAFRNNGGVLKIQTVNDAANSFTSRVDIDHSSGDVSFYDILRGHGHDS
jgi:hypothetical protein